MHSSPPCITNMQKDAHLFPFSVLVQHNHHQSGMHLIAFLSEGQVFAIPCHIDHKSREKKRERQVFREEGKRSVEWKAPLCNTRNMETYMAMIIHDKWPLSVGVLVPMQALLIGQALVPMSLYSLSESPILYRC